MLRLFLIFVPALMLLLPLFSLAASSEVQVRVRSSGIQKVLLQALRPWMASGTESVKQLDDYSQEIPFSLSGMNLTPDMVEWARTLGEVDLKGQGRLKVLLQAPEVKGEIRFGEPTFARDESGRLDVAIPASVTNFRVRFDHIWLTSQGIAELHPLSDNSCHHLLTRDETREGEDFLLNSAIPEKELRSYLKTFYNKLKRESFRGHVGKIWSRIDGLEMGYPSGKVYSDNRNRLILNLRLKVDPRKGGEGVRLVSFAHNLYRKGGARLPVVIPRNGIVIPPTFVRTQARKVVSGVMTDQEITRCTFVDHHPLNDLIPMLSQTLSRSIAAQLTDANVRRWASLANEWLERVAIPELPSRLVLTPEEKKLQIDMDSRRSLSGLQFDFHHDLYGIFRDFSSYRAALGLGDLMPGKQGDFLSLAVSADLMLNQGVLGYRETTDQKPRGTAFPWSETFGADASLAVSGRLLNKIINPIKDQLLRTYTPDAFHVRMDNDLFGVDSQGRIDLSPEIELDYSGVDLLKVTFTVKAKPVVFTGQDGRTWLRLNLEVPDASRIIANMRPSAEVSTVYVVANLLFGPLLTRTVSSAVLEQMRREMQTYISDIRANVKDIELTSFVKETGLLPRQLSFRRLPEGETAMEAGFGFRDLPFVEKMVGGME